MCVGCLASREALVLLTSQLRMGSEVLPHVVSSNDLGPKETAMLNPNGPHSIAHILQSLEKQLDEYVDDIRYASSTAKSVTNRKRANMERLETTSTTS